MASTWLAMVRTSHSWHTVGRPQSSVDRPRNWAIIWANSPSANFIASRCPRGAVTPASIVTVSMAEPLNYPCAHRVSECYQDYRATADLDGGVQRQANGAQRLVRRETNHRRHDEPHARRSRVRRDGTHRQQTERHHQSVRRAPLTLELPLGSLHTRHRRRGAQFGQFLTTKQGQFGGHRAELDQLGAVVTPSRAKFAVEGEFNSRQRRESHDAE